ncbi:MAG: BON domain-containing protein, partial [Acidobacteria bacterium]|nr:BON domain-containing protein [Acidobacteriota bacterium]
MVPRLGGAVCLAVVLGGALVAPEAFAGAQDAARDAQLAVRVKTALVNDVERGTMPIGVVGRAGAVTLRGAVGSAADAERAVALARGVDGVASARPARAVGAARPPPPGRPRATPAALAPPPGA